MVENHPMYFYIKSIDFFICPIFTRISAVPITVKNSSINMKVLNVLLKNNDPNASTLDKKKIKDHICEILEGGDKAFKLREKKYNFI